MSLNVTELAAVLEEEITVAEELSGNLAAQKAAIVAWDASELLQRIERKEACLRALAILEQKRNDIVKQLGFVSEPVTLRQVLAELPHTSPERARIGALREQASHTLMRLHADERDLGELMQTLLSHIQGALSPLTRDRAPVYTETGAAEPQRASSALVQSKA